MCEKHSVLAVHQQAWMCFGPGPTLRLDQADAQTQHYCHSYSPATLLLSSQAEVVLLHSSHFAPLQEESTFGTR